MGGSVNFTVIFNATSKVSARGLPPCYFLRHPDGCADYHDLRNIWLAANDLLEDSYKPHNNLSESFTHRWVHSISAVMSPVDAQKHLQEFYSFISPIHDAPARIFATHPQY